MPFGQANSTWRQVARSLAVLVLSEVASSKDPFKGSRRFAAAVFGGRDQRSGTGELVDVPRTDPLKNAHYLDVLPALKHRRGDEHPEQRIRVFSLKGSERLSVLKWEFERAGEYVRGQVSSGEGAREEEVAVKRGPCAGQGLYAHMSAVPLSHVPV